MIHLLYVLLFVEVAVALLLMVKFGPLRELAMKGLDKLKTGKGPAMVKALACTLSVILASSITGILRIQNRGLKLGSVTPTDQVLWRTHLLEASLIGYTLFLALLIDRLHHCLQKVINLRKTVGTSRDEVEKLKKEHHHFKDEEEKSSNERTELREEVCNLTEKLQKLKSEIEELKKRALTAEAHVAALQKQFEKLLLEYDRLLEDNQILQTQALAFRNPRR
ncbi:B-cell receptor-associated protein 29-like [Phoenix dactylifera]|uniref:Endoplasmic reticulum transmembrane protein n=1 Tax=Phoenix dactylifera TaxID=42345 RepID=A0A8B7CMF3_PHODC|nr:B-cell receptor-associated protein 29-like [Phoenix dactylifera]